MTIHYLFRLSVLGAILMLALPGCGGSERLSLEGTVSLDGRPLEKGAISFRPQSGTKGPTAGAEIVEGKFSIPPSGGPLAGKFVVEITASGRTGHKIVNVRTDRLEEEYTQILPARYNRQSELTAEVTAHGRNQFEFKLSSR